MISFMIARCEELRTHPQSAGRAVEAGPIGNRTTAHLNLTIALSDVPKPSIAITKGKKK